jgi:hypothetical protein
MDTLVQRQQTERIGSLDLDRIPSILTMSRSQEESIYGQLRSTVGIAGALRNRHAAYCKGRRRVASVAGTRYSRTQPRPAEKPKR